MVLSSVLNQGSRLLRSPAVLGAAVGRGGALRNGQQTCLRPQPSPASVGVWTTVRVGVHHRAFWDWSGAGKGGDQGGANKGSDGAAESGGDSSRGKFGGSSECGP